MESSTVSDRAPHDEPFDSKQWRTKMKQEETNFHMVELPASSCDFDCYTDPAYWEEVSAAKSAWIIDGIDPRTNPKIRRVVADSWVISLERARSHFHSNNAAAQTSFALSEDDRLMISAAQPLFRSYIDTLNQAGCTIEMFNAQCVVLLGQSVRDLSETTPSLYSIDPLLDSLADTDMAAADENALQHLKCTGVLAHTMAIIDNEPCVFASTENYWNQFKSSYGFAAPIRDEAGRAVGAVGLVRKIAGEPYECLNVDQLRHSLQWVISLANDISVQTNLLRGDKRLLESYRELERTQYLFQSAINIIEDPVLIVSSSYSIIDLNEAAEARFGIGRANRHLYNLLDVLDDVKLFDRALAMGSPLSDLPVSTHAGGLNQRFSLTMLPAKLPTGSKQRYCTLRFMPESQPASAAAAAGAVGAAAAAGRGGEEVIPIDQLERQALQRCLEHTNYNVKLAAAQLGMSRSTFYRKMKRYNILDRS